MDFIHLLLSDLMTFTKSDNDLFLGNDATYYMNMIPNTSNIHSDATNSVNDSANIWEDSFKIIFSHSYSIAFHMEYDMNIYFH